MIKSKELTVDKKILTFNYARLIIALLFFSYGCGLFLSPYSVVGYKNFTDLKAFHLKFIDDFTNAPDKVYNQNKIDEMYNFGDLRFREALEYEKQRGNDRTRINAFEILYEQFKADYKHLINKQKLYSNPFAEELKGEIEKNYNLAIKGELSRRNTPTN